MIQNPIPETDQAVFHAMTNPQNWKLATAEYFTESAERANAIGAALDFYLGGHEKSFEGDKFIVSSLGYYRYVGA